MRVISVPTGTPYEVTVGAGVLRSAGHRIRELLPEAEKVLLVTDENLDLLWADYAEESLRCAGLEVFRFSLVPGETSKEAEVYLALLHCMAEEGLSRTDVVVALGGGMVCDIAGFAAATYLRGIPLFLLPTSLLAMVDAAVGGKTAMDLPEGKNLVGAFYQPRAVLCDIDTLNTLPKTEFTEGCAEILKYAILRDRGLLELLKCEGRGFPREQTVADCIEMKAWFVAQDETDRRIRKLLNLGHTIGHAVECASHYTVGHGSAVAIGISVVAAASLENGLCSKETVDDIRTALQKLELPLACSYRLDELFPYLLRDKKRHGDKMDLVVPIEIGNCRIETMPAARAADWLKAGMR